MRKQLLLKVFPRKEFVEGIINNNREATSLVSYSLISSCFTFIECLVMSTINHRKKGSKKFLSIAFVCVVVVFFSIIIIIIIIDNFSPFFFKNWKKKDMVKNQLPIIFSPSNFRTTTFFNNSKMLQTFPFSNLHRMEHFTSKITRASLVS